MIFFKWDLIFQVATKKLKKQRDTEKRLKILGKSPFHRIKAKVKKVGAVKTTQKVG